MIQTWSFIYIYIYLYLCICMNDVCNVKFNIWWFTCFSQFHQPTITNHTYIPYKYQYQNITKKHIFIYILFVTNVQQSHRMCTQTTFWSLIDTLLSTVALIFIAKLNNKKNAIGALWIIVITHPHTHTYTIEVEKLYDNG